MQLVSLPDWLTLVLFILMWPVFQLGAALWCKSLDISHFEKDGLLFTIRPWEKQGQIYR